MKTTFTSLLALMGLTLGAFAQDACYTFEEQVITPNEAQHTFNLYGNGNPGFLEDWWVSSGTPSVYTSGQLAGVDAYEGNQYVLAGICDISTDWSDCISVTHNFEQGHNYNVTLAIRNAPLPPNQPIPIDLGFYLLEDTIAYTYNPNTGCSPTPAVPAGALSVHSINSFSTNSWQLVSFQITNVPQNFTQLWFRPVRSAGSPQITTLLCLDSLCITEELPSKCQTFDEQVVPANESQHAFNLYGNGNPGFLEDWHVTSGTPSIYTSGQLAGVDAFEGDQYAIAGVCDISGDWSEGLSVDFDFMEGHFYRVSVAMRNAPLPANQPTPLDVDFILLENPIAYTYNAGTGCSATPDMPNGSLIVHGMSSFSTNSWQVVTFDIFSPSQDYSQLWFRALRSQGAPQVTTLLCLDSLCISEILYSGINEQEPAERLALYPNPSNGEVVLNTGSLTGNVQVEVLNVLGQQVHSVTVRSTANSRIDLDLGHLPKGQYIIRALDANKQAFGRVVLY